MKDKVNIPKQNLPPIRNEKITPNTDGNSFRRYIVRKFDGTFYEVNKNTYDSVKRNPFFDNLILNWYIRGTETFVRRQNQKELDEATKRLQGIKRVVINPLQFYINDNR